MDAKPIHPTLRLVASGILCAFELFAFGMVGRVPGWTIAFGGAAVGAFVFLIPVLLRGDSWQKMLAGMMLFIPCFGLVVSVYGIVKLV